MSGRAELTNMKTPGPQNPGETGRLKSARRSRYFFLAAFFLAAGFLAAFFFAAMMVYLLDSISDPMKVLAGPNVFFEKVCHSSGGRLCDGNHEQLRFQIIVILEPAPFFQWEFA